MPENVQEAVAEGIHLFNERSYYEAHDVFEDAWAAVRGPRRKALKALVWIAAGMYHLQTSGFSGAERLLGGGLALLRETPPAERLVAPAPVAGPVARCLSKIRVVRGGGEVSWDADDLPRLEPPREP